MTKQIRIKARRKKAISRTGDVAGLANQASCVHLEYELIASCTAFLRVDSCTFAATVKSIPIRYFL